MIPVSLNPIVESTEIIEDPMETFSKHFVFWVIVKFPSIADLSSYPMKSEIL